jgi:hypothetical protein
MADNGAALTLGDLVSLQRGTTYKSALLGQPGPTLLGLASIQRNGGFRNDNLKTYGGDSPDKLLLGPGDIYVSLKDVTQSADLLGAIARVPPAYREWPGNARHGQTHFRSRRYPGAVCLLVTSYSDLSRVLSSSRDRNYESIDLSRGLLSVPNSTADGSRVEAG